MAYSRRTFLQTALATPFAITELKRSTPALTHQVIDIHCHPRWHGHSSAKMIQNMDDAGIDKAWLISWEAPEREISPNYYAVTNPLETGIPFRDVVELCERYPERFIPGTTVDPRDPHAHDKLQAAVEIHGVRVFGEFKLRIRYDDPDVLRLFKFVGELGLPVIFHLDVTFPRHSVPAERQWWYGGSLENMEPALKLCPETTFIGHAPGFWREISGDADEGEEAYPRDKPITSGGLIIKYLDQYPNLHCDLSAGSGYTALTRDPSFTYDFLIKYQDRLLFGRDAFDNRLYDLLISLELPDAVLGKILSGNANRLAPIGNG